MSDLPVRTIDGSHVEISSKTQTINRTSVTSWGVFDIGGRIQEFGAGMKPFGDICASDHGIKLTDSFTPRDHSGVFRFGQITQQIGKTAYTRSVFMGVWEGDTFAVKTTSYSGYPELVALFDHFTFEEDDEGVTVHPRTDAASLVRQGPVHPVVLAYPVGVGILEIAPRIALTSQQLPSAAGVASADGSQVYVEDAGGDNATLLQVGNTCVTRLYPKEIAESDAVRFAQDLKVSWVSY